MSQHIDRATLLLRQSRYKLAELELRQALAMEPGNAYALALLAVCIVDDQRQAEAIQEARNAVHQRPDMAFTHYALATVFERQNRLLEAKNAIEECVRLDPANPGFWARMASIAFNRHLWTEALDAANSGLMLNPMSNDCQSFRGIALVYLGRMEESATTIRAAMEHNPENGVAHMSLGALHLHRGEHLSAIRHYQEALRLDPTLWAARSGLLEAMKARNPLYRWLLGCVLGLSRLSRNQQALVMLAATLSLEALIWLSIDYPATRRYLIPILIPYVAFLLLMFVGGHVFNLLLRFDPFGRKVLTSDQVAANNMLIVYLIAAVAALAIYLWSNNLPALILAITSGTMTVPICGVFHCPPGRARWKIAGYIASLGAAGSAAIVSSGYWKDSSKDSEATFGVALSTYAIGWILCVLATAEARRRAKK